MNSPGMTTSLFSHVLPIRNVNWNASEPLFCNSVRAASGSVHFERFAAGLRQGELHGSTLSIRVSGGLLLTLVVVVGVQNFRGF